MRYLNTFHDKVYHTFIYAIGQYGLQWWDESCFGKRGSHVCIRGYTGGEFEVEFVMLIYKFISTNIAILAQKQAIWGAFGIASAKNISKIKLELLTLNNEELAIANSHSKVFKQPIIQHAPI